jgi:hypothetical protein
MQGAIDEKIKRSLQHTVYSVVLLLLCLTFKKKSDCDIITSYSNTFLHSSYGIQTNRCSQSKHLYKNIDITIKYNTAGWFTEPVVS